MDLFNHKNNIFLIILLDYTVRNTIIRFISFQDLLTVHKNSAAQFLEKNYDRFFSDYKKLLKSENYVTRRQSLKVT